MMAEVEWSRLKAPELRALAKDNAIVIVPVGSTEQHGPHLPTQVDCLLAGEIARRAAILASHTTPTLVTPTVWSGLAEHHMSLGATLCCVASAAPSSVTAFAMCSCSTAMAAISRL
jgi:creatinine amidohydrolase